MSEIEFEDSPRPQVYNPLLTMQPTVPQGSGLSGWLLRKGIVKTKAQAGGVILAFILVCLSVTGYTIYTAVFGQMREFEKTKLYIRK